MSPESSPERRPHRESSPMTPISPLSPSSSLPQWLRHTRPRTGLLANAKFRVLAVALGCIMMGWMLTSMLGPGERAMDFAGTYDAASGGILDDPTGFGMATVKSQSMQPGIIGGEEPKDEMEAESDTNRHKQPSVTGALSELHDAVKDKLKSWNPYHAQPVSHGASRVNSTATASRPHGLASATATALAGEAITDGISDEERLGARTRIGKCTILFNGNSFWERAIRTHERHDREHGYRLHVLRQHLMDDVWSKPAYILSLLLRELSKPESERLEWLFWVDADTIILNPHIPIEVFLPPPGSEFDDVHLLFSNDWNGLNNGVFPVRVNQWSVQLFSAITSFRHYRPDAPLPFRDQSAMDALMHEPAFSSNLAQAPQRWFNAYQGEHNETLAPFQIRRGDFLVHFAGVLNREERMGYWLERAEQHLDDWEVPVKSTSYPQEVRDFWSEQKDLRRRKKEALSGARLKAKELMSNVEEHMEEYGDRMSEEQKSSIEENRKGLYTILESGDDASDLDKMEEAMHKLEESFQPLTSVVTEVHKTLLNSAHEAIFAGEKDLLQSGFNQGSSSPELERISDSVKHLKYLVMTPQENWNRHDITAATDAVTDARAKLQEKEAATLAEARRIEQAKKQAGIALDDVQKQAADASSSTSSSLEPSTTDSALAPTNVGEPAFAAVSAATDD
ncbi:glycosyltransferase family 34 protein [Zasmidium cellare ATCC 36951]|uniref:Glycosyltransferase family 34 protein n=1 Tax=Zasmidium cellare ATCC 36951 TaxID=1080233 RepID=A0A6A6BZL8_ZASCE|nr:glycosyltransferase family 34 protein [Zasmidium cellare ATCC 36951]KAF2159032.1 glycosyltransferase family 34 protein [Zasmidium cellare ATCC 36951]